MAFALGIATSTEYKSVNQVKLDPIRLERNIRQWCRLFAFINHARIYLIHQTAKEFLICDSGYTIPLSGWKHCLDLRGIERHDSNIRGIFVLGGLCANTCPRTSPLRLTYLNFMIPIVYMVYGSQSFGRRLIHTRSSHR
jgi:hypothetical protein